MSKTLKDKTDKDLSKELGDKQTALRTFRFSASGGKAKNAHEGHGIKKEIARIMTEQSARLLAGKK